MTTEFQGRRYRKLNGRRYGLILEHLKPVDDGKFVTDFSYFARLMALSLANEDGSWVVEAADVEAKVVEMLDDWDGDELLAVGQELMTFNNMGLKAEGVVEKN